jgi:hypothetical protein
MAVEKVGVGGVWYCEGMKVDKQKFEALVGRLLEQKPAKRETLKTGEKKTSATIIPPSKPQPDRR